MKLFSPTRIISVFLWFSLCCYKISGETISMAPEFPEDLSSQNKRPITLSELQQRYDTFSRTAVARDAIFSNVVSEKHKFISTNNGLDFNVPIDKNIMNKPIGTYQYTDSSGDIHIVNYINDSTGLKILNDYKPYVNLQSRNKLKDMQSIDPKSNDNWIPESKDDAENESKKDINWDDYEFTFVSKINTSKSDKNDKDLSSAESDAKVEKTTLEEKKVSNVNNVQHMTNILNSIPLPQPFIVADQSNLPFFQQRPDGHNNDWSKALIPPTFFYGSPLVVSTPVLNPFGLINTNRQ